MDVDEAEEEGVVVVVVATWEEDGEDTWEGEEEEDVGEAEGGINRGIGVVATVVEITTATTETSRPGVDQHLDRIIGGRKQLQRQRRTKACLKNNLDLGGGVVLVGMAGEMFFVLHCQSLMVNHLRLEISNSLNS